MYVSMKKMLEKANRDQYAVMAINCFNLETARSVISAAEKENAPIIINIFQDHLLQHCDSELITPLIKTLAARSNIDIALNFDHGQELSDIRKAIDDGFSSVMVDAFRFDLSGNIAQTKEIVDYAHPKGVSVEGELGCIGSVEGEAYTEDSMYTDPKEAAQFAAATNIDALAVSVGSSHGTYPAHLIPDFDFDRLKSIKKLTGIPLVLHGGSGSGEKNILAAVKCGINKINVGCDFMQANVNSIEKTLKKNPAVNFFELITQAEKESIELVRYYIQLSGSSNKAALF